MSFWDQLRVKKVGNTTPGKASEQGYWISSMAKAVDCKVGYLAVDPESWPGPYSIGYVEKFMKRAYGAGPCQISLDGTTHAVRRMVWEDLEMPTPQLRVKIEGPPATIENIRPGAIMPLGVALNGRVAIYFKSEYRHDDNVRVMAFNEAGEFLHGSPAQLYLPVKVGLRDCLSAKDRREIALAAVGMVALAAIAGTMIGALLSWAMA